jgi:hypothetical protein
VQGGLQRRIVGGAAMGRCENLMFTFSRACLRADMLMVGSFLVFAPGGCGARTGFDAAPVEGAFVGPGSAVEDAGGEPGLEDASSQACSSFTSTASCIAGGCSTCISSTGWWICMDQNEGAFIEDDAGNELGACGNLNGDVVTGPRRRL